LYLRQVFFIAFPTSVICPNKITGLLFFTTNKCFEVVWVHSLYVSSWQISIREEIGLSDFRFHHKPFCLCGGGMLTEHCLTSGMLYCSGEHMFSKRVICYFSYLIGLDVNFFQIQIYSCKANHITDTTLHRVGSCFLLYFAKYSPH